MIDDFVAAVDDDGGESQTKTGDRPAPPDPFLDSYDTSQIKLNDETLDRLLGMAVVVSNLST